MDSKKIEPKDITNMKGDELVIEKLRYNYLLKRINEVCSINKIR